jgi:hypothetical protein
MRAVSHADWQSGAAERRTARYCGDVGTEPAGWQVRWRLQISVGSQAGLHWGMHCPAWQAKPGEQIGVQPAATWSAGGGAALGELAGATSLRAATVAEMNIPAPSGLIPSLNP